MVGALLRGCRCATSLSDLDLICDLAVLTLSLKILHTEFTVFNTQFCLRFDSVVGRKPDTAPLLSTGYIIKGNDKDLNRPPLSNVCKFLRCFMSYEIFLLCF